MIVRMLRHTGSNAGGEGEACAVGVQHHRRRGAVSTCAAFVAHNNAMSHTGTMATTTCEYYENCSG